MRVLALVLAALALMSAAAWIMRHEPSLARRGSERTAPAPAHPVDTPELAQLRAEVRALRGEVAEAKASAAVRPAQEAEQNDRAEPAVFDEADAAATRAVTLSNRFDAEGRDARWSRETARSIEAIFDDGSVPGTQLVATECRTTLCRVQLRHDDDAARADLAPRIAEKTPFGAGVYYVYSEDPRQTTLYVSRARK